MTKDQIADVLRRVAGNQLKDTHTAIKSGHKVIALKELEDAMRVLKQLAAFLEKKE